MSFVDPFNVFCTQNTNLEIKNEPLPLECWTCIVMTLALDLQPKQGAWKGAGQKCNLRVIFMLSGVQENVRE